MEDSRKPPSNFQLPHSAAKPLVVIVGETGSGKSTLALQLAETFNGEIISADSWAVYKGFDIGTAKPTKSQQAEVPHHLIDIVDALDGFNAAQYKLLALQAIQDIQTRDKLPIIVGGTGLYIDSVIFDYGFLPVGNPVLREKRNNQTLTELMTEAKASAINLDGIDIQNKRRVIRAIETNGQRPTSSALRQNTLILGVSLPPEQLRRRIEARVDEMIKLGLEEEVRSLVGRYGWDTEPLKGIGYVEWREYLGGSQDLWQTRERIIKATMGLAKRQRSWFKRNKRIQWCSHPSEVVDIVTTFLNKLG